MPTLAYDHRDVVDPDVKAIEEHLNARVGFDVLIGEGLAVTAEKLADLLGTAGVARAEQDHVLAVLRDERHPPEDEGAHQDLAELRVSFHEITQSVSLDRDDRAVASDARAHQAAPGREHVDLAGELPRLVHGY